MAKQFFSNITPREQLGKLIEDVANSGVKELKKSDLKEFKNLCKNGDDDLIDFVYRMFVIQLEKNHCQKRYSTILLIEQLFPRSHRFRTVFTEQTNLSKFFELTLGSDKEKPLPKPRIFAKLLKDKVNLLIKEWIDQFGKGYPYLEQIYKLALSRCEDNLTTNDPNGSTNNHQLFLINDENPITFNEQTRTLSRIEQRLIEYTSLDDELPELLTQMRNCFDLVIPKDEFTLDEINQTKEMTSNHEMARLITTTSKSLNNKQQVSITLKPYIEIKINENNEDTICILKDLYRQLVNNYLPKIKNLLKHLSKGGKKFEREVKQLIDYKSETLKLMSMYTELRFLDSSEMANDEISDKQESSTNDDENNQSIDNELSTDDDDDDFEEVEQKDIEYEIPPERWFEYGLIDNAPDNQQPSTSGLNNNNNLLNYDPNVCNVKMANGKLCQRKDLKRCPFHGPIIERDHYGLPIDLELRKQEEEERKRKENDWQDPDYLKELENQIGIDLTIKKVKVKKNPELLNLRTCDETPKSRILKRIKTLKKYSF